MNTRLRFFASGGVCLATALLIAFVWLPAQAKLSGLEIAATVVSTAALLWLAVVLLLAAPRRADRGVQSRLSQWLS